MWRYLSGGAAAALLATSGLFMLRGQAESNLVIPAAPTARLAAMSAASFDTSSLLRDPNRLAMPPAATARTREEKRFGRVDKDDDGRITRVEMFAPRQKAFAKLDKDGDGRLAFDEWAVKTVGKFAGADGDGNGALTEVEYATTAPKARPKTACRC